jgi:ADP-dependent phosphofructokinase/glucokinase
MNWTEAKKNWKGNYGFVPEQLQKMADVKGLISAYNANIDAVIKLSAKEILRLIDTHKLQLNSILSSENKSIQSVEDVFAGLLNCFKNGIAEEWLIGNIEVFQWLQKHLGYDKLQMGGQGGIVANVMAVCGVQNVYVHCASLAKEQTEQFLDLDNLLSTNESGELTKARDCKREKDLPLIHWIIEFDKGDEIVLNEQSYTCPKSNRFIATYDPLNFKLHIDSSFSKAMSDPELAFDYIILSGYQMLHEKLSDGNLGKDKIDASKKVIDSWRKNKPEHLLHLEMASTQDKVIRKYLLDSLAMQVDSLGFNERELIDLMEVMGEEALAQECENDTHAIPLFKAIHKLFQYTNCERMQLHMFGLYLTLQKKNAKRTPLQNRNGMQLAATIAAAKAGTGSIDHKENLLWAKDQEVSDVGLQELSELSRYLKTQFGENKLTETGIFEYKDFDLIAVPTILIDKPVTLVGMGDTISSISLVGAQ